MSVQQKLLNVHDWQDRVRITLACRDADHLPRVPEAGDFETMDGVDLQIMHNGIRVIKDAYCGHYQTQIIHYLKGFFEPQEELCFYECLKYIPPQATIVELGSWWGYYSLWFFKHIPGAKCYLVEADWVNLQTGVRNFLYNQATAIFTHAAVAGLAPAYSHEAALGYARIRPDGTMREEPFFIPDFALNIPNISVDGFARDNAIDIMHVLHVDVQGTELGMLKGAAQSLQMGKIHHLFISTHGDALHQDCLDELAQYDYEIVAEHNTSDSFSGDGMLYVKHRKVPGPSKIEISRRRDSDLRV